MEITSTKLFRTQWDPDRPRLSNTAAGGAGMDFGKDGREGKEAGV
jgi:hypothetical protein